MLFCCSASSADLMVNGVKATLFTFVIITRWQPDAKFLINLHNVYENLEGGTCETEAILEGSVSILITHRGPFILFMGDSFTGAALKHYI